MFNGRVQDSGRAVGYIVNTFMLLGLSYASQVSMDPSLT
jgi:hypothetical protein